MIRIQKMRRICAFGLSFCLWSAGFVTAHADGRVFTGISSDAAMQTPAFLQLPDWDAPYPFTARDLPLTTALKLFSKNLRIGLVMADGIEGKIINPSPATMNRRDYLKALALEFDFVWYFDGSMLRVSPVGATETRVLPLVKHEGYQIVESLRALDIYQPKFVHRFGQRSRTLRVTGPSDYIELVEGAVEAIDQAEWQKVELVRGNVTRALDEAALAQ